MLNWIKSGQLIKFKTQLSTSYEHNIYIHCLSQEDQKKAFSQKTPM